MTNNILDKIDQINMQLNETIETLRNIFLNTNIERKDIKKFIDNFYLKAKELSNIAEIRKLKDKQEMQFNNEFNNNKNNNYY